MQEFEERLSSVVPWYQKVMLSRTVICIFRPIKMTIVVLRERRGYQVNVADEETF